VVDILVLAESGDTFSDMLVFGVLRAYKYFSKRVSDFMTSMFERRQWMPLS
jgi:hypothetical protein